MTKLKTVAQKRKPPERDIEYIKLDKIISEMTDLGKSRFISYVLKVNTDHIPEYPDEPPEAIP